MQAIKSRQAVSPKIQLEFYLIKDYAKHYHSKTNNIIENALKDTF